MITSVCIRCGKQRIVSKVWDEQVVTMRGETTITYTETVCPDVACQKIVEKELASQEKKRLIQKEERDYNAEQRRLTHKAAKK